jgi:integrase
MTLLDMIHLDFVPYRKVTPGTEYKHRCWVKHLWTFLQREPVVTDLNVETIRGMLDWMTVADEGPQLVATSAIRYAANIHSVWKFAATRKHVARPPKSFWSPSKRAKKSPGPQPLTAKQVRALLGACARTRHYVGLIRASRWWTIFVSVQTSAGVTTNELLAAKSADLADDVLTIGGRTHRIHPRLLTLIRSTRPEQRELLLPWPFDGGCPPWDCLYRRYRDLLRGANLPADRKSMARLRDTASALSVETWIDAVMVSSTTGPVPESLPPRTMAKTTTLLECFAEYERVRLLDSSPLVGQKYRYAIEMFSAYLGRPASPKDLTDAKLAAFMQSLRDGKRTAATVNDRRKAIVALWKFLNRHGVVETWPEVKPLRQYAPKKTFWTQDELAKLFQACADTPGEIEGIPAGKWWLALHAVLYDTAARRRPIFEAALEQFDPVAGTLMLKAEHQKTGIEEVRKLSPETIELINAMGRPEREKLFPWPTTHGDFYYHLGKLMNRAGLPNDGRSKLHRMRRTSGTMAAMAHGVEAAAQHLGHAGPRNTLKHYVPLDALPFANIGALLPRPKMPKGTTPAKRAKRRARKAGAA